MSDDRTYTLVLRKDGRILFRSRERGLKPLVDCLVRHSGRVAGADLEDRVVGMAAARLICFSGMISRVEAGSISEAALNYLRAREIDARGGPWRSARECRWERLAAACPDDRDFLSRIKKEFGL